MRFCPFCSAENADELAACQACGRRLPPLPPRRARNAPPTGVQLPPRAPPAQTAPPPQRRSGNTAAPPSGAHTPPLAPASGSYTAPAPPSSGTYTTATPPAPPTSGSLAAAMPISGSQPAMQPPPQSGPYATQPPPAQSGPYATQPPPAPGPGEERTVSEAPIFGGATAPDGSAFGGPTAPDAAPFVPRAGAGAMRSVPPGPLSAPTRVVTEAPHQAAPPRAASRVGIADRDSAPSLPPPPTVAQAQAQAADDAARRALLGALTPGPAAQRREPAPIPRVTSGDPGRRRSDASSAHPPFADRTGGVQPPLGDPPTAVYPFTAPPDASTAALLDDAPTAMHAPAPAPSAMPPPTPARGLRPPSRPFAYDEQPTTPAPPQLAQPAPAPLVVTAQRPRATGGFPVGDTPPPTRIQRGDAGTERPFTPPKIASVPEIPEPGLVNAARYAARFARARYQRRGAIKVLGVEIKQDTEALDGVLGALGREARARRVEGRVFSAENGAITAATERIAALQREHVEVDARKADENSKFGDVERERTTKLSEAERGVEESARELMVLEGQRRGLRDRRKDLERRQKAHLKAAEDQDRQAGAAQMGDQRSELRRAGESHRREAAALEPERQECDRALAAIERPIAEAIARQDAAKAELDAAKRSLSDAREGHTHRLAELDAEAKRKAREVALAEAEITRRLVTLGTLVNLNRIDDPSFGELYLRIDRLRGAITARTTEIEKLTAERDAFDRGMLVRGISVIGGAFVLLIALIVILRAII